MHFYVMANTWFSWLLGQWYVKHQLLLGSLELDPCLALLGCRGAADDHSELWRIHVPFFFQLQLILIHLCKIHISLYYLLKTVAELISVENEGFVC